MNDPCLLFSTPSYRHLALQMASYGTVELGELETYLFPDGERYMRLQSPVPGRRVALLGGTVSDADTLFLYDLAYSLAKDGARSLTLIIPYFGYSTMERRELPGEVVTAKSRARLLSSVPVAHHGNSVLLLDLHTGGLPHYFEGAMTPVHLSARSIVLEEAQRIAGDEPFVMACTDAGRAKWVESLANDLGTDAAFVLKRRIDGNRTEVSAIQAAVEGRTVVIYDDMVRTGGSMIEAARAYTKAGATRIAAITTHGIFPGTSLARLRDSELFTEIVCTDSHPRANDLADDFLRVRTVAPLLHEALESGYTKPA